jgi:tetratricopeptide (TPR) repeat protein
MEETNLHKRVSDLEEQVKAFKASVNAEVERSVPAPVRGFAGLLMASWVSVAFLLILSIAAFAFVIHFFQSDSNVSAANEVSDLLRLLIRNWVLVAFVGGLAIVAYVKIMFGLDYFENYRSASTTRDLSRFYEKMGDRLMGISEWQAAEEAYKAALKINPNNTTATYGIAKAQVFNPVHGEKVSTQEVIDARLEHLFLYCDTDYQLHFLQGLRFEGMMKYDKAKASYDQSIEINEDFIGAYLGLGSIAMAQSDPNRAQIHYAEAVRRHPYSAVAKNDLGACLIRLGKFSEGTAQLIESYTISPTALIAAALGEAYWFSLNFRKALEFHQYAADYLNANPDLQDRYTRGGWRAGFLPLRPGDLETGKQSVEVYDLEGKKSILHFQLAIDHALLEEFDEANEEFEVALKLRPSRQIRQFVQNGIQAAESWLKQLSEATKTWLSEHFDKLK